MVVARVVGVVVARVVGVVVARVVGLIVGFGTVREGKEDSESKFASYLVQCSVNHS